jgi:hypothetical protein
MTPDKSAANQLVWNVSTHKNATTLLFSDLVKLSQEDPEVFAELYYNRGDEHAKFDSILDSGQFSSRGLPNVLIVGDAGIGKSNFIHRVCCDGKLLERYDLFPIVIDYHSVAPTGAVGCKLHFIERIREYFQQAGAPIHTLVQNVAANVDDNIFLIMNHLRVTPAQGLTQRLIIFLDDFDYAEEEWFKLLDFFRPFAASDKASVVFSIRPPLIAAIDAYDDRFRHFFLRDVQRIDLVPLNVANVLTSRLAPFLLEHKEIPLHRHFLNLFTGKSAISRILKKLGIQDISDLPHFDYPFTQRHNAFMARIANGNLREIFEIALTSLDFVCTNYEALETRIEEGVTKKVIGRENVLKLFFDPPNPSYKMLNLHMRRSGSGNSLLFNTVQAVKVYPCIDQSFFKGLKSLGHSKPDVDWALQLLADRQQRLITPKFIRGPGRNQVMDRFPEFSVTEKGNYYLQLAEWVEYTKRVGDCGSHLLRQ